MRWKKALPVLLTASLLCGCGCTVIRELPFEETKEKADAGDAEYLTGRALLEAFIKDDGKAFVALLPEETRKTFTLKAFEAARKSITDSMGTPVSFQYVTKLEMEVFTPRIWKIKFERTDAKKKQTYRSELLFRVITGREQGGRVAVTGFQFL